MLRFCVVLFVVIAFFSTATAGKLYKWKDADGKVHYSDNPVKAPKNSLHKIKVKATPSQRFKVSVPDLSIKQIKMQLTRGKSWDQILKPSPPMPGSCRPFENQGAENSPDLARKTGLAKYCLNEKKSRRNHDYARLGKKIMYFDWMVKRRGSKPAALEKIKAEQQEVENDYFRYEDWMTNFTD